MERVRGHTRNR